MKKKLGEEKKHHIRPNEEKSGRMSFDVNV
jgi:hypothetical protein